MDLDVFYAGDCDINFVLGKAITKKTEWAEVWLLYHTGGMKGGIKDFQIHG